MEVFNSVFFTQDLINGDEQHELEMNSQTFSYGAFYTKNERIQESFIYNFKFGFVLKSIKK